jgi:protein-S-isoprenylcysteine O-methyltransferase Ste14
MPKNCFVKYIHILVIDGQDDVLVPASNPQELQPPLCFAQTIPASNAIALRASLCYSYRTPAIVHWDETMFIPLTFILGSAIFAYVSRASLLAPRSHGFCRFFAWETILALTVLNLEHWFDNPFAWYQLVSWFLLMVSLFLVIHGVRLLRQIGKQNTQRNDSPMLEFEKTTTIVTDGAYRYIRHPLYSSLLFLAWGIAFKLPGWLNMLLALIATAFLVATARAEEAEDIRFFGPAYQAYMHRTKMFIPFFF